MKKLFVLLLMMFMVIPIVVNALNLIVYVSENANSGIIRDDGCNDIGTTETPSNYRLYSGTQSSGGGFLWKSFLDFNTSHIGSGYEVTSVSINAWYDQGIGSSGDKTEIYQCNYGNFEPSAYDISFGTKEGTIFNYGDATDLYYKLDVTPSYIDMTGNTQYCAMGNVPCIAVNRLLRGYTSGKDIFINITYEVSSPPTEEVIPSPNRFKLFVNSKLSIFKNNIFKIFVR